LIEVEINKGVENGTGRHCEVLGVEVGVWEGVEMRGWEGFGLEEREAVDVDTQAEIHGDLGLVELRFGFEFQK